MTTINNLTKHDSPEFKVGDLVVRRGSIHYLSKSYALWRVIHVLQTTIPCIEVAPVARKGRVMLARAGVYVEHQFDHATPLEIKAGHRIDDTTDHVTDIRNHVSPSTIITELHVNETEKLNRLGEHHG